MSRNDQVTRQWLLLKKLEDPRGATLNELAASLPEDYACHPRTIRRDIEALESCFPLVTDRINGQTRWRLMDGYLRSPSTSFSTTELMALTFSRDLLKPLDGTHLKQSLDSVLSKASNALPAEAEDYVRRMKNFFSVGLGPHRNYRRHRQTIEQLTRAIDQNRTVQIRYYSASRLKTNRREVDPYRLWYASGALYLIGYCHLRRDVRMFAVERIRSLAITNHPCQLPLGFDLESYVSDALMVMLGRPIEVELLFDRPTAAWVKGSNWHPSQLVSELKDGRLGMSLRVADTRELVGWILSFGAGVRVVGPEDLRDRVHEEARKILKSL